MLANDNIPNIANMVNGMNILFHHEIVYELIPINQITANKVAVIAIFKHLRIFIFEINLLLIF